jgi:hypothetical protein
MIGAGNRRRIWRDCPAILDIGKMKSLTTTGLQRASNIDTYIIHWGNVKSSVMPANLFIAAQAL